MARGSDTLGIDLRMPGAASEAIFASGNVTITPTLIKVGNVSHPISAVVSVLIKVPESTKPPSPGPRRFVAAIVGLATAAILFEVGFKSTGPVVLMIAAVAVILLLTNPTSLKKPAFLSIRTANGDQELIQSDDVPMVLAAKAAIQQAISARG